MKRESPPPPPPADGTRLTSTDLSGSNLERASDHNQRVVLQAIRVNEPVTKPDLGAITGLTAPTVGAIIRRLVESGIVREDGLLQGARGQPAMRYAINSAGMFSIGVNVDRDHVTLVALDFVGTVCARVTREVAFALPDFVTGFVAEQIRAFEAAGTIDRARLAGIGVAMPDDLGDLVRPHWPADYALWRGVDLRTTLAEAHGLPVYVANDATAAAIGELQFGHGLADRTFFYVFIGAYMGGGLVVDGQAVPGADNRSGEIGFLPIDGSDREPRMLQDVVSVSGLLSRLEAAGHRYAGASALARLSRSARALCEQWCDEAAELLAGPLATVNAIVNPRAIYIGGRLPPWLMERLSARLTERMWARTPLAPARAKVQCAAHATDAGALGAAVLPFSDLFLPTRSAILKEPTLDKVS